MNAAEKDIRAANATLKRDIEAAKEAIKKKFWGKIVPPQFFRVIEIEVGGRKVRTLQGFVTAGFKTIKRHQARIEAQSERGKAFARKFQAKDA